MTDVRLELSKLQDEIRRVQMHPCNLTPSTASHWLKKLAEIENSLAAPQAPARLVVALSDGGETQDRVFTGLTSTVPMIVFVVDHREKARERLSVVRIEPLANTAELIEVVSDEVADYMQCNPELLKLISENC